MRETLQLHTSGVERGQMIQAIVRTITCVDPEAGGAPRPIVDLDDDVGCHRQARISRAAPEGRTLAKSLILVTVVTFTLL